MKITIGGLQRTIDWKQACNCSRCSCADPAFYRLLALCLGFAILVWALSVFRDSCRTLHYGELATMFPRASDFLICPERISGSDENKRYEKSKLLGGFSMELLFCLNTMLLSFNPYRKLPQRAYPCICRSADLAMYLVSGATVFLFLIW